MSVLSIHNILIISNRVGEGQIEIKNTIINKMLITLYNPEYQI